MIALMKQKKSALAELCQHYRVARLDLFGSAAREDFVQESSDLDFIVAFESPGEPGYAARFLDFADELERLFACPVDLLTEPMIRNPYFREAVEETRQNVYDARSEEAIV